MRKQQKDRIKAVSLVPTTAFAEEPAVVAAEETAKNDNLLSVWYDKPAKDNKKESRSGTEIKNSEIQKTVTRKDS